MKRKLKEGKLIQLMIYILRSIGVSLVLCFFTPLLTVKGVNNKPNVLLIYTDDHRYSGVHALGGEQVLTPHIDKLADEGIVFNNAYLMGSFTGATCMPSRAMLHTGRNLFQLNSVGYHIPKEHTTIGEALQQEGYNTQIIGKWHQDHASLYRSFHSGEKIMGLGKYLEDHYRMPFWDWPVDGNFSSENAYLLQYNEEGDIIKTTLDNEKRGPVATEIDGPHTSEVFADNAISFLTNYKKEESFFMYLAFHAPHDPRQAPQKYRKMYPLESIELPPSYMSQHPFDNGHMILRDEKLAEWPRTVEIAKQQLADYYAIISHLDSQIGRVLAALKASGKYNNTIIMLIGDSGLAVGCHGLMGKQNLYDEDGIHVPFIISGNLVNDKGSNREALCYIHDVFPTICDLTGTPIPASVSGSSLVPVINKNTNEVRESAYYAYRQFQRAYRQGDYKLIEYVRAKDYTKAEGEVYKGSRVTQLFNIKKDPWETFNLAVFPEYQTLLLSMKEGLKNAAIENNDTKEALDQKYNFWDYWTD